MLRNLLLIALAILFICPLEAYSAKRKSAKLKPRWVTETPVASNSSYYFKVVYVDNGNDLETARPLAAKELIRNIEQTQKITVEDALHYTSRETGNADRIEEASDMVYDLKVKTEGEPVYIRCEKQAEYWEESDEGGRHYFKLYALYAVARKGMKPAFDNVTFTPKYGARGFVRSLIIPGWGQLYKGNTVKGACMLGGEVAFVAMIIAGENLRASYKKKMKEQPSHLKTYNTKADNWENVRNVCIGGAAALYVYNLIDALVADGRERAVVRKQKYLTVQPVVSPDCNGVSLAYHF